MTIGIMMKIGAEVVMEAHEEEIVPTKAKETGREPAGIAVMTRTMMMKVMMKTTMRIMTKRMIAGEGEVEVADVQDAVPVKALVL